MGLAMPGLGQIYNGELIKGISYFVILQACTFSDFDGRCCCPTGF